jgi:hypothetical protein
MTTTKMVLGLECSECMAIVTTIEDALKHEQEYSTADDPHGGWDTVEMELVVDD